MEAGYEPIQSVVQSFFMIILCIQISSAAELLGSFKVNFSGLFCDMVVKLYFNP